MVLVLKKGADRKMIAVIDEMLSKSSAEGFNAKKYNGAMPIIGDALEIQKNMRNDWERNIG